MTAGNDMVSVFGLRGRAGDVMLVESRNTLGPKVIQSSRRPGPPQRVWSRKAS